MRRTRVLIPIWLVLILGMGSVDCDCGDTTFHGICLTNECEMDADCSDGLACEDKCCGGLVECGLDEHCEGSGECCRDNECTTDCTVECDLRACVQDVDCEDLGVCMECAAGCCESFACESDADCPPEGGFERFCSEDVDPELGCRVCEFVRCDTDEQCSDPTFPLYIESCDPGLSPKCKNGICECSHPCGGECPDGQFCCLSSRTCDPIPDPCPGVVCDACMQVNPEPGGTLDEQACEYVGTDCTCVSLPPLPDAFAGQHSAIALGADGIPVLSGYFGLPYGDLIYGPASSDQAGASVSWTYVDGVPADAPCEGAADGPRGGIAEPGDDVGWNTDVVVDFNGLPRISYFDRTHGDLRYAAFDGAVWNIHVLDEAGITGRFTSMVLDAAGRPVIAYMTTSDNLTSYLKVARATTPNPAGPGDFTFHVVDAAPVPCIPVDCDASEACILETGLCEVLDDPANCHGADGCDGGQVCVEKQCQPEDAPANCNGGAGCADGEACVAGTCVAIMDPGQCSGAVGCNDTDACIAGQCEEMTTETSLEDLPPGTGLFANIGLYADGAPAVGYYDNNHGNLMFAWWNNGANDFDPPVILAGESGGNDTGNLGADVDMFIAHPADSVHLAYQDADLGDLYYMTFPGTNVGAKTVELVDVGARDANGDPTDPGSAVGGLHWVGNFASTIMDVTGTVRVAYQDGTSLDMVYATREPGGWNLEILARRLEGESFDGNYGFFIDQVLNQAGDVAIISNFKHNLRTDPFSSAIDIRTR